MDMDLPMGFGMALAQNEAAMKQFESLSEAQKQARYSAYPQRKLQTGDAAAGGRPLQSGRRAGLMPACLFFFFAPIALCFLEVC